MTLYHFIFVTFAVVGVLLNNRRSIWCFPCWGVSSSAWLVINAYHGLYVESLQNLIFIGLAVEGWIKWKK